MRMFDRQFHPAHRTAALVFIAVLVSMTAFDCIKGPLTPKTPRWPVDLFVPLIDRTYTFDDMIRKDRKFRIDSATGDISYVPASLEQAPSQIDLPSLSPVQGQISNKLGIVPVAIPTIPQYVVRLGDLVPVPSGVPWPGPEQSVTPTLANIVGDTASFDYVVFESGTMSLQITNNFPFSINFPSGVQLVDADDTTYVVASFTFSTLGPGASQTSQADLAGKQMSSITRLKLTIQTVDMTGKTMTGNETLVAQTSISGATMSSAKLRLSGDYTVNNTPDSSVTLVDDSTYITRAIFKHGVLQVRVGNAIATDIVIGFHLNEFYDLAGRPFTLRDDNTGDTTGIVPAKGTFIQTIHMKDYEFVSSQGATGGSNALHFSLNIKTLGATSGKQIISKTDSVEAAITPMINTVGDKQFYLSSVSGRVKPTNVAILDTVPIALGDISNKLTADSISFDSVTITLNVLSSGLFPTDLAMKLIALDQNNQRGDSLIARDLITNNPVLRIEPGATKQITFTKQNSTIDRFLSSFLRQSGRLPDKILVVGNALMDPPDVYSTGTATGSVSDTDKVYTSVDFLFPVRLGIVNGILRDTVVIGDTSGQGEQKIDKKNIAAIDSGRAYVTVENGFPFAIDLNADLMSSKPGELSKPDSVLLSFPVAGDPPITVDSSRYFSGGGDGKAYTFIGLTPAEVEKINPSNFAALTIHFRSSGNTGTPVIVRRDAKIHLKVFAKVSYQVDTENFKK